MGLLRRNSPIADAEREVAALRTRRDALATKLAQAELAIEQVTAARRTRLVEGDDPDDAPDHVAAARERRDSLIDAIAEVDQRLSAAVQKLSELRDTAAREKEAAERQRQVAEAKQALLQFTVAAEALVQKLQPLAPVAIETGACGANVQLLSRQLAVDVEVGLREASSYVDRVIGGGEQIRTAPKPVEPPPPKPPEIARQLVFLRHASDDRAAGRGRAPRARIQSRRALG